MPLTPELFLALLQFATKFGIEAGLVIAKGVSKSNVTLDDAITALDAASKKSAEDYLKEAKALADG